MSLTVDPEKSELHGLGRGMEAFERSPEFRGPVESLEGHACNDHFAQIYETDQERFAAAVPFVRHGLDNGERVLYLADDSNTATIQRVLSSAGIDVEGAIATGALSIRSVQDTYLDGGCFDPDEMVDVYAETVESVTETYDALRIVAETTWVTHEDTTIEQFMEYESKVNHLFDRADVVAVCQYDRNELPPAVIRDVVRTHPHLIYGDTVCHNFYYTPPGEFFGPEQPAKEVDRMLGTLADRSEVKRTLERRQSYLRRQTEIFADPDRSFEEKLQALFDLGCDRLDLDIGGVARVDPDADQLIIEHVNGDEPVLSPGQEVPLSQTYCQLPTERRGTAAVLDPSAAGLDDILAYRDLGVSVYLGTFIEVEGGVDRTFFFASKSPRQASFTDAERTFLELMGEWAADEFRRRQREDLLQRSCEITAAPDRSFDDKLAELLSLGRDWLDLDVGYVATVDDLTDQFEVTAAVGSTALIEDGQPDPTSPPYCRHVVESSAPLLVRDVETSDLAEDHAADDVASFVGRRLFVDEAVYGALCFASSDTRKVSFTDFERTYVDLIGQWITYEIERLRRERRLEGLHSLSRSLIDAEDSTAVAESVVRSVADDLDLPVAGMSLYDEQAGALEVVARAPERDAVADLDAILTAQSGPCWEAFVSGEVTRRPAQSLWAEAPSVDGSEFAAIPLGKRGVLLVGTASRTGMSDADLDVLQTAAATVSAALDRVDREGQLQERERTLEQQNETLERLNRINDTIRRIDQALVESTSREEIESVVCEELAAVGPYELAWIGNHDPVTEHITPTEIAGADKGYFEDVVVTADEQSTGNGPGGRAVKNREPQVVNNVIQDSSFEPWCQAALNRGYHSLIALPLEYQNSLYGILVVYAGQPNVFDQLERTVLTEMADTIAHAINAVESKKAIVSDEVIELEFGLEESTFELVEIARSLGCEFSFESLVLQTDGPLRSFGTVRGVSGATFSAEQSALPVRSMTSIIEREHDSEPVSLFEFTLDESSLSHAVWEHGARIHELEVSRDCATLVVHLAADAEIREFVEMLKRRYPGTELHAQRRRSGSVRTETGLFARLTEDLTDRQREALQTAYVSGYFEQPRARTASEIAATMNISQPTFTAHLRHALEKLCDHLFATQSHPATLGKRP